MDKIIWQPVGLREGRAGFGVIMNEDFAREMIRLKSPKEFQKRLNQFAASHLSRLGIDWERPFQFY